MCSVLVFLSTCTNDPLDSTVSPGWKALVAATAHGTSFKLSAAATTNPLFARFESAAEYPLRLFKADEAVGDVVVPYGPDGGRLRRRKRSLDALDPVPHGCEFRPQTLDVFGASVLWYRQKLADAALHVGQVFSEYFLGHQQIGHLLICAANLSLKVRRLLRFLLHFSLNVQGCFELGLLVRLQSWSIAGGEFRSWTLNVSAQYRMP